MKSTYIGTSALVSGLRPMLRLWNNADGDIEAQKLVDRPAPIFSTTLS